MSKKTFIHAENNHNILSSKEVRLYNPPKPEEMKVIIWGKELCSGAEWNDFLKCVEEKTIQLDQLKQQLAEKDCRIEELEGQFAYECECNMQLVDLQKQLEEKQKTINEINKEFVQAVHDWKTLCAEKDKEIESLKQQLEETNAGYDFTYEQSSEAIKELKQNQTQLAIQELEKVKDFILENTMLETETAAVLTYIYQQIKELKGEKDAED